MDLFDAITQRYSYRGAFVPHPAPEEDLREVNEDESNTSPASGFLALYIRHQFS